eukprot:3076221-Prymnesium_polylepis.2
MKSSTDLGPSRAAPRQVAEEPPLVAFLRARQCTTLSDAVTNAGSGGGAVGGGVSGVVGGGGSSLC